MARPGSRAGRQFQIVPAIMPHHASVDVDVNAPPFDRFRGIHRLSTDRSGHSSVEHVRHHLYVGRDARTRTSVLFKLTAKPGLVYQHNLSNEIATLTTINRKLPASRYFPEVREHGRLRDGRVFLIATLFDELPLATAIGTERMPDKMVSHLRIAIEVARALTELHGLDIFHVDLNPMNILARAEKGRPVIRIVDFESSYDVARHAAGEFYNPPTTSGYSAPEVSNQPPDAGADVFSLGAVLYTLVAGYQWTWAGVADACVKADRDLDPELKGILLEAVDPDPGRRCSSARELEAGLGAFLERIWPGRTW
jgi:serine/threonine protein kinase